MIDMLPDNVLLEIFDFYREDNISSVYPRLLVAWRWEALTQVCRRWRCVIFGSPLRLDMRVICTDKTPTRTSLDIWPPFPIAIACCGVVNEKSVENIITAVEHGHDRITHILIEFIDGPALEKLAAAIRQPLPTLKHFRLTSLRVEPTPVLPETILGGSAPLVEGFELYGTPFPTFPQFILSSTHIRNLSIFDVPHYGYISPNAMVACLAALPNLGDLSIGFRSPLSRPLQITAPPHTRIVLPALTDLLFNGVSEYFEDFVGRIDTPLLNRLHVTFFMDLIFDIPRLRHFIGRAERFTPFDQARILISNAHIVLSDLGGFLGGFTLQIRCERPDWQLSSIVQIFDQQLPLLSHVEHLEIYQDHMANIELMDNPDMDSSLWLDLFHLFIAAQSLRVSHKLVPPVATALQELRWERTMEVLPALHSLFLEGLEESGPLQEGIRSFVASRQQSDHPVVVQSWEQEEYFVINSDDD
jgi:F-box-like